MKNQFYVNLEPCNHTGKTPPCTDFIIKSGIRNVVVACLDPNTHVIGKGISKLIENGINVTVGVCERQAKELKKIFLFS